MGFFKNLFSRTPKNPDRFANFKPQPAENMVPLSQWTGPKSAYVLVLARGHRSYTGSAMDLHRGLLSMISEATDQQRAEVVNVGALFQADFDTSAQAAQNKIDFVNANPDFAYKAHQAFQFALYGPPK